MEHNDTVARHTSDDHPDGSAAVQALARREDGAAAELTATPADEGAAISCDEGADAPAPALAGEDAPPPLRPRVIVMHASVGSGHRSAALAIAQAFELLRDEAAARRASGAADGSGDTAGGGDDAASTLPLIPEDYEVEVLDVLDWGRIKFDGDHAASLFTGATRPIYDLTWRYTLTGRLLWAGGSVWSRIMFPAFTEHVRKTRPLAVVCTHITAANVAVGARMLSGVEFPIISVPTDYETEGLWPHRGTDVFCVANESMAETLRARKLPEERIRITGIPTREDFRRPYDQRETRERWGLPQDKTVALALAGAHLPRPYVHFREALDKLLPYVQRFKDLHLVIIAGRDENYARHLRQAVDDLGLSNVTILDYVEDMAALMAASDLVICKSGGLVVTECLCAQVPMILLGRAYGQEKVNVRMLTALGAAMHVTTARELLDALRHIEKNPESIRSMLINGSFLRHPDAARDVAHATFEAIQHPKSPDDPLRKKHFLRFYWGGKPAHTR